MIIIEQSWEWLQKPHMPLELIELAGRTCYKSEERMRSDSAWRFVKMLLERGHHSVIEHPAASVKFVTDRGVTHELVRHRLASYSQESTRYCNYGGDDLKVIKPVWIDLPCDKIIYSDDKATQLWYESMAEAESTYHDLLQEGWRPEQARSVLPNSLKTEIVMTANLREWRHVFRLRTSKAAHPQMRELMLSCLKGFRAEIPVLFDDLPE